MGRRYSFLVIFFALLTPLAWWSGRVETSNASVPAHPIERFGEPGAELSQRRELLEVLDRLVAYEHYYRSVYGHFTKLISRLGYPIPPGLSDIYEVRVSEAAHERLLITAFSEVDGRTRDLVSVDQDYEVRASFDLPAPRPEYLKSLALKQLRLLRDAPFGQSIEEQGLFRGYFRYELRQDSQDRKNALAVGIKAPVVGIQLELGAETEELAEQAGQTGQKDESLDFDPVQTGQKPSGNVMSTLEEAYLAQRIFRGEVGRYAKSWSELAKIAAFRFEDKAKFGQESQVPFGDAGSVLEIDAALSAETDKVSQDSARVPSSDSEPIEIEEIYPESKK